jgi:hypothetical protein
MFNNLFTNISSAVAQQGSKVNQIPKGAIQTKDSGKYLITKTGKYIIIKVT